MKPSEYMRKYIKISYDEKTDRFWGKCPFCHRDINTFTVSDKTGTYYCYACGRGGFVKELAEQARKKEEEKQYDKTLLDINRDTADFYHNNLLSLLQNKPREYVPKYVKSRKMNAETIEKFNLGYAPKSGNSLYHSLKDRYSDNDLIRAGVVNMSENGEIYDFFRDRLMFPISENGSVIAFGGRIFGDGKPKYLNSHESELFLKGSVLYGFPEEQKSDTLVICEGYMDLIAVRSAGVEDSAAVLGTALTERHIKKIKNKYKKVILSFDSDEPGINAALRSIRELQDTGIEVSVAGFSPYKDPDECIKTAGKKVFMQDISEAVPVDTFLARNTDDLDNIIKILLKRVS